MNVELPFPVSAQITGVTKAATFTRLADALADALAAVRAGLARLPPDADQAACLAGCFGEACPARIAHRLIEFGAVRAMACIGVESVHPIHLRVANPE
ncbi:hypothetical protein [Kitasatospora brasiliensis]|uniref:hypothetical protein n=1 Tax=Kitasatospora brasiliensis TaxID=3058040 RepID=UPI0029314EB9|nr:hypothetical protein [Kitasatospora sp. K002]